MDAEDLFEVVRREVHYLPSCPCLDCSNERERRAQEYRTPADGLIRLLTPVAAFTMRLIPRLNKSGSVARDLASRRRDGDRPTECPADSPQRFGG